MGNLEGVHSVRDLNTAVSRLVGPNTRRGARDVEGATLPDLRLIRSAKRLEVVIVHISTRADEVEQRLELCHLEILWLGDELDLDVDEERRELLGHLLDHEA